MQSHRMFMAVAFTIIGLLIGVGTALAQGASGATPVADVWPREFKLTNATLLVYQPQVDSWDGNLLDFRAAVGVKSTGSDQETFGVIWGRTRTQVDRVARTEHRASLLDRGELNRRSRLQRDASRCLSREQQPDGDPRRAPDIVSHRISEINVIDR